MNTFMAIDSYDEPVTVIMAVKFGSHLYGTATPNSDTDIRGVFIPSLSSLLLGRAPRHLRYATGNDATKNTADDRDETFYSLHYFLELAAQGETEAIDMLHARPEQLLVSTPLWQAIYSLRSRFYTRNLKAFVGYARRQAAKYGVKGSRLQTARVVLALIEQAFTDDNYALVESISSRLAELSLEHVDISADMIEVCGKRFQRNARVAMYIDTMRRFTANYGERARQAEANEGIDWKAMSHALRAAYEVQYILTVGDLVFPLPEAPYLLQVKRGKLPFADVATKLKSMMETLTELAETSTLPAHVDRSWWDGWLLDRLRFHFGLWR